MFSGVNLAKLPASGRWAEMETRQDLFNVYGLATCLRVDVCVCVCARTYEYFLMSVKRERESEQYLTVRPVASIRNTTVLCG